MVKKVLVFSLAGLLSFGAAAQQRPVESLFQIGLGVFVETVDGAIDMVDQEPGMVLKLSYGLDIPVADAWSVLPGVGLRDQAADIRHIGWDGGDPDGLVYADAFVLARWHFTPIDGTPTVFSIGPDLSYELTKEKYYIDADPWDDLSGKRKYKPWDIGLLASITFERGAHWQFGAEACLGLRNLLIQYPDLYRTGNRHFHTVMFTCGYRF